jgi:guanylate kinase
MSSQRRLGLLFVLVGPPGVGKNTLMNAVLERFSDLKQLPTATTRPPRASEQQGREHLFVNHTEFEQMIQADALIESQEVHGEWYGMPKATVEQAIDNEQDLIADIDVKGATYLRVIYPDNAVLIFIQPASTQDLRIQMQTRGETDAEIEKRMRRVEMEMNYAPLCDYLITNENGNIEKARESLYGIILAERSHRALINLRAEQQLPRHKVTYVTSVIAFCGNEVLYHTGSPHFSTAQITYGEFPHDAALRALAQDFGITPSSANLHHNGYQDSGSEDTLIMPVSLENHIEEHHQQIAFFYIYRLANRLNPPQDWAWIPYQNAALPENVTAALRSQLDNIARTKQVESSHEPA